MKTFMEYQEENNKSLTEVTFLACGGINPCVSPYSVGTCLSMLTQGAEGKTRVGLEKLTEDMPSRLQVNVGTFSVSNMMWAGNVRAEYVSGVREAFGALVDQGSPAGLAGRVNSWVADKTNGLITSIMNADPSPDTMLILLNAIYFLCRWETRFDKKNTIKAEFMCSNGPVKVDMMSSKISAGYLVLPDEHTLLRLNYEGGKMSCTFCLPPQGAVGRDAAVKAALVAYRNDIDLRELEVDVKLPRFDIESSSQLLDAIDSAGARITSVNADLSGISKGAFVSSIAHKARVKCDEDGTEAAAVTAITVRSVSFRPNQPVFLANRPFGFVIEHVDSDVPLFIGAVCNPS